jgi:hypothetical protein
VDNDHVMAPEDSVSGGISRRQMLVGTGALAAGLTFGQFASGASKAFAAGELTPADMLILPLEWPTMAGWESSIRVLRERGA